MRLDTMGLFVADLPKMVAFYQEYLGLTSQWDGNPDHADLFNPESGFRLMLSNRAFIEDLLDQVSQPSPVNMRSELAFLVPNRTEVDRQYAQFKAAGIQLLSAPVTYPWGQRAFYFADPEGNLSEIFAEPEGDHGQD